MRVGDGLFGRAASAPIATEVVGLDGLEGFAVGCDEVGAEPASFAAFGANLVWPFLVAFPWEDS